MFISNRFINKLVGHTRLLEGQNQALKISLWQVACHI